MRTLCRSLAASGLLLLVAASAARADGFARWRVCGGSSFNTCAAVYVSVSGTNVTMQVWNLSGAQQSYSGTVFTRIGFFNLPTGVSVVENSLTTAGRSRGADAPGNWSLTNNPVNTLGGQKLDFQLVSSVNKKGKPTGRSDNGLSSGCAVTSDLPSAGLYQNPCGRPDPRTSGDWLTFNFQISGYWDPQGSQLAIKGKNGPDGQITRCITGGQRQTCGNIEVPPGETPEPVSMALVGTGLVGMSGVSWVRRRREQKALGN